MEKILQLLQFYAMYPFNPFLRIIGEPPNMIRPLRGSEILENLKLLSDWLRVKYPGDHFELIVVGGATMALNGFKEQTTDIDILRPEVLPDSILNGIAHIARVKRLGPEWINTNVANMLLKVKGSIELPEYFNEISRAIEVADNLKIGLVGRQALISLKMYAATPSYRKHTDDIRNLHPNKEEISEAVRFVLSIDSADIRKDDLRAILKDIGYDFGEIYREPEK